MLTGTPAGENIDALGGNDWILPGAGADVLDGGSGVDMVSYTGTGPGISLTETEAGFSVRLDFDQFDLLMDVERLTGTSASDTFSASEGSFRGLGGSDFFRAEGGGIGAYDGGAGNDNVSYGNVSSGIAASLFRGIGWQGDARGDSYTDIGTLTGTIVDDGLWGDRGDNGLAGLRGDDTLVGAAGDDTLNGGNGFDTAVFFGGVRSYDIDFGSGSLASIITVDGSFAQDGDEGTDSLLSVEVLRFSDAVLTVGLDARDVFTAAGASSICGPATTSSWRRVPTTPMGKGPSMTAVRARTSSATRTALRASMPRSSAGAAGRETPPATASKGSNGCAGPTMTTGFTAAAETTRWRGASATTTCSPASAPTRSCSPARGMNTASCKTASAPK